MSPCFAKEILITALGNALNCGLVCCVTLHWCTCVSVVWEEHRLNIPVTFLSVLSVEAVFNIVSAGKEMTLHDSAMWLFTAFL